jgi:RNA polymerase sigma-70 factor (ECF subfamily)
MTNTSVVLGDGTPEAGWDDGALVCASTDAAGRTHIRTGKSRFMVYLDSFCFGGVSLAYLIFARSARPVTRLRKIDLCQEIGHKCGSRGKGFSVSEGDQELRALMIRYQGGSLEAFQEIYAQLAWGVRRYLSHLAGAHLGGGSEIADDLLQETFLQMHRSRAAYNPEYAVKPWVFGLARNVFLMNRRAARQWAKVHESREDLPEFPVLPEADRLGSRDEIRRGIAHLHPEQAEALLMTMSGDSASRRSPGCWALAPPRLGRAPAGEWRTCASR